MKVCACTTRNCGPNVKNCGVLVTFSRFGSGMDCWESTCPTNLCPWSHTILIWKSCFPAIHWLNITSLLIDFNIYCCVNICFKINSKILLFSHDSIFLMPLNLCYLAIVKPFKLYMFYDIFMALYYLLLSMSISTFKVCWGTPCGEAFYFPKTILLIRGASQVSGFCMVWIFNVKNIQADYRFCCFKINKVSYYVIFSKVSCTADLLVPYLDAC